MATYSAQDIIKAAFRVLGVTSKSESPTADEMNDALQSLNFMIDNWAARRLLGTALIRESFPLTAFQQSYTIGVGGNFNTAVPFDIMSAFYRDSFNVDRQLEIVTREQFDSYEDKQIVSALPEALFFDPGPTQQVNELGTIYLYFTPDASSSYTLFIESQKPFTEFAALTTTVTFPPSYYRALKWNLALELAAEYGRPITQDMNENAIESLETLEAVNAVQVTCTMDMPGTKGGGFNWISGEPN